MIRKKKDSALMAFEEEGAADTLKEPSSDKKMERL